MSTNTLIFLIFHESCTFSHFHSAGGWRSLGRCDLPTASSSLRRRVCQAPFTSNLANVSGTEADGDGPAVTTLQRPLPRDNPPWTGPRSRSWSWSCPIKRLDPPETSMASALKGTNCGNSLLPLNCQNSVLPTFNIQCKAQHFVWFFKEQLYPIVSYYCLKSV